MGRYLVRRLLQMILVFIGVTLLIYGMVYADLGRHSSLMGPKNPVIHRERRGPKDSSASKAKSSSRWSFPGLAGIT